MKKFLVLFLLFFSTDLVFCFEIVYPKTKNAKVSASTTFFIGSSNEPLTINEEEVKIHPTGGFAHFVKLPSTTNTFTIKSKNKTEIFTIKKQILPKTASSQKSEEYKTLKFLKTIEGNSPLRSTPISNGINRLSHLQKDVLLTADGEIGNFYRVKLNETQKGWISKKNVVETNIFSPAAVKRYSFNENKKEYILSFELNKRVPYKITEGNMIGLDFYNTDRDNHFTFYYSEKSGAKKLWGYSGQYDGDEFLLKIRKPPIINKNKPLKGITITVDAGHGGKEKGAIGCFGDKEKDIVLEISKYLKEELKSKGANVVMTREDDNIIGLYDRVNTANVNDSVFFISIHNNALPDSLNPNEHSGTSVYYYYDEAKDFGQTILDTMVEQLGTNNDGLRQQSFAVVRNTSALSILIEVAYLINPNDNALLTDNDFQKSTAKAIANGIEKYILNSI